MHILLVEDNPGDVRLLKEYLAGVGAPGFTVVHADRLASALQRLAVERFDAVVLDLSLPDSHGLETVMRLRAQRDGVPIVVLTSLEDEAIGMRVVQAGAQDYLVKGQVTGTLLARALRYAVERKRGEDALRRAEAKYHAIFEQAVEGIYQTTPEGRYLSANPALARMYGYDSPDELMASVTDIAHQLYVLPGRRVEFRRLLKEHDAVRGFESEVSCKDGSTIWISESARVVRDEGGATWYYEGTVQDVSERKRAEENLRASEARMRALLESTGEGIYGLDLKGCCTFINGAGARMLGFEPEELQGTTMHTRIHHTRQDGTPYPEEECRIYAAFRAGEGSCCETEVLWRKDGTSFPAAYSSYPIFDQGTITGAVVTFTDITTRKEAEEQLKRSHEQLRDLTARVESVQEEERTRIAREIHDELGQALTILKLDLSWVRDHIGSLSQTTASEALTRLESMLRLIDATTQSVQKIATELRPIVLDQLGLIPAIEWQAREFQSRTGIPCEFNFYLRHVPADSNRLTAVFRIFQEILTNVARHANATRLTITLREHNRSLVLEVMDNGRGITLAERADRKSLGLLGMRERASLLGGDTHIAGTPGKGTTVTVRIPLEEPKAR